MVATYQATVLENKYIPSDHEPFPRQQDALILSHETDVMMGGAAGGGKSDLLLMMALQWIGEPDYAALLIRQTHQELMKAGALIDRSHKWLANTDAHWDGTYKVWKFPSGARLEFGYLDQVNSELQYQSAEYQFVGIDQVEQFENPRQPLYLLSRLRRLKGVDIPTRFRSTSNPGGPGFEWVKKRWVPDDDEYEDLREKPVWTKQLAELDPITGKPLEASFVFATIADNPALDADDYIRTLAHLLPIERERLMKGNWKIIEGGKVINRDWFKTFLDAPVVNPIAIGRGWDLAATDGPEDNPQIKRTAGVKISVRNDGLFVIEHCIAFKKAPGKRDDAIVQQADIDGPKVSQYIEEEGGSGGKTQSAVLTGKLKKSRVIPIRPTGDKYVRAGPFASACENGHVALVRGDWIDPYLAELNAMQPEPPKYRGHKDRLDASSLVYNELVGAPRDARPPKSEGDKWKRFKEHGPPAQLVENFRRAQGRVGRKSKMRDDLSGMMPGE